LWKNQKKKIKTIKEVGEDGFTIQKKVIITKGGDGKEISRTEFDEAEEEEEEEKKSGSGSKGYLMNNMYEMVKLDGSYEKKNIELAKAKNKKGQHTVNNRELQQTNSLNQNKQIREFTKPVESKKKVVLVQTTSEVNKKQNKNNKQKNNAPKNNQTKNNQQSNQKQPEHKKQPEPKETNKKNQNNNPKQPDPKKQPEPKVPEKKEKKNPKQQNPVKRPTFTPTQIKKVDLAKIKELTKKKGKQWYEDEWVKYAAMGIIVVLFSIFINSSFAK